jgi:hypothetical protein
MGGSFLRGVVVGLVCALLGGATVALAGSGVGGVFNLGVSNSVDAKTTLTGASPGAQLRVDNTNAVAGASGLAATSKSSSATGLFANSGGGPAGAFTVNAGVAPFTVNSSTKVGNLNADLLDGLDSAALQKRVTGTCAAGTAVRVVNSDGSVSCQAVGTGGAQEAGWAVVRGVDGVRIRQFRTSASARIAAGHYRVTFLQAVSGCEFNATIGDVGAALEPPGGITVTNGPITSQVDVFTFAGGATPADHDFHLSVHC